MAYVAGEVAPAMKPNYVLRSWREGGQNLGAWLDSPDAFITENMGTRAEPEPPGPPRRSRPAPILFGPVDAPSLM